MLPVILGSCSLYINRQAILASCRSSSVLYFALFHVWLWCALSPRGHVLGVQGPPTRASRCFRFCPRASGCLTKKLGTGNSRGAQPKDWNLSNSSCLYLGASIKSVLLRIKNKSEASAIKFLFSFLLKQTPLLRQSRTRVRSLWA